MYKAITGKPVNDGVMLRLPDVPWRLPDARVIELDGSVTPAPSLDAAVNLAVAGDCDSWLPAYEALVAADAFAPRQAPGWTWFRRIIKRESGCGLDVHNERTNDSGVMQLNPVHRGWLMDELGIDHRTLRTREGWANSLRGGAHLYGRVGACAWNAPRYCR
jgi:hypothetical protein